MTIEIDYIQGKSEDPEFNKQLKKVKELARQYEDKQGMPSMKLSFGGDGTFQRTANANVDTKEYLFFVRPSRNRSSGFMADVDFDNLEKALKKIADGDWALQTLPRLDVEINDKSVGTFMGDMWIDRGPKQNTIEMQVEVEYSHVTTKEHYGCEYAMKHFYDIVKSDGILIYLPLASSAYNRTLGGPMVDWDSRLVGIKYMAPCRTISGHTGYQCDYNARDIKLEFSGWEGEEGMLRLDWMTEGIPIKFGDKIRIKEAGKVVQLQDGPREIFQRTSVIRVMPETIYEKQVRHDEMHFARTKLVWRDNAILKSVR